MAVPGLNDEAESTGRDTSGASESGLIALLSLNLLLLAFFILLTAIASIEEQRLVAVVHSVNEAFEGRVRLTPSDEARSEDEWPVSEAISSLSRLSRLFRSHFPMAELSVDPEAGEMRMELDAHALFPGGGVEPGPVALRLLDSLQAGLEERGGEGFELEFFHGYDVRERSQLVESEGGDPVFARTTALIRAMRERGIGEPHLSAGLVQDAPERFRLVLRLWGEAGEPPAPRRHWR